jgi:hypothetical protein
MTVTNAKAGTSNLPPLDGATVGAVAMVWRFRSRAMDQSPRGIPMHQSTLPSTTTTSMESLLRRARSVAGVTHLRETESHPTAGSESGLGTQTTLLSLAATLKSSRRLNICHIFLTRGATAACLHTCEVFATDRVVANERRMSLMVSYVYCSLGLVSSEAKSRMLSKDANCIAAVSKRGWNGSRFFSGRQDIVL